MIPDPALEEMTQQFLERTRADGKRLRLLVRQTVNPIEAMAEIRQLVHRLAGTAGTFGFSRLSETAHVVEELFTGSALDPVLLQDRISTLLAEIAEANQQR
jgi:chemotaxis protein histidine kinase CheA